MTRKKYPEKVRLDAVKAYLSGQRGLKATAQAQGVGVHSLRSWVAAYQAHGVAGIQRKPRMAYDPEFKLRVLGRIREEGLSYRQAGALFGVRRFDQIGAWERAFREKGLAGLAPDRQMTMKKKVKEPDLGEAPDDDRRSRQELLREVQQLRMENAYLKKLEALVQDKSRSVPKKGR
jgi:transposase